MIKRFCDNCQEEIKDQDFRFEARISEIKVVSQLLKGILNQKPQLEQKEIHLDKKCYDKKFK